jgi:hypothetical protein
MYFKFLIVSVKEYYNPYNLIYLFMRKNMIILWREKKNLLYNIIEYIKKRIKVHVMSCEYVIMYNYSQSEYAPSENWN